MSFFGSGLNTNTVIHDLAKQHHIAYTQSPTDALGYHITRLSGDDNVVLDDTELLLLALERAGHVSGSDAVRLHADYLHLRRHGANR